MLDLTDGGADGLAGGWVQDDLVDSFIFDVNQQDKQAQRSAPRHAASTLMASPTTCPVRREEAQIRPALA